MADDSHIDDMRNALRGDRERAEARRLAAQDFYQSAVLERPDEDDEPEFRLQAVENESEAPVALKAVPQPEPSEPEPEPEPEMIDEPAPEEEAPAAKASFFSRLFGRG